MKKIMTILAMTLCTAVLFCACGPSEDDLPIEYVAGAMALDMYDLREKVGFADNVFVGTVKQKKDTVYDIQRIAFPYTIYSVEVLKNIKGDLAEKEEVTVIKDGGVSQDRTHIVIFQDDILPKVGKTYMICAQVQPDGIPFMSGPNSSVLFDVQPKFPFCRVSDEDIENSELYREFLDAYAHQKVFLDK